MTESIQTPQFALEGTIIIDTAARVNTSGAFCDLFTGTHPIAGKVALKRPRDTSYTNAIMRLIEIEARVWIKLNHPRILEFLGLYTVDEVIYFVSPYAEFGSLPSYLRSFPDADRRRIVIEIAEGLAYLHQFQPAIVHGDVKGNNVLIGSDHHARLCDFGLARHVDARTATALKGAGSTPWQSPEILRGVSKSLQSDVYAFGITIYEVLSGKVPYPDHPSTGSIIAGVLFSGLRPTLEPSSAPDGTPYLRFWSEATRCWSESPPERPSMVDILRSLSDAIVEPKAVALQSSIRNLSQNIVSSSLRPRLVGVPRPPISHENGVAYAPKRKAETVDTSILRAPKRFRLCVLQHSSVTLGLNMVGFLQLFGTINQAKAAPPRSSYRTSYYILIASGASLGPGGGVGFGGSPASSRSSGEELGHGPGISEDDRDNWTLPRHSPPMRDILRKDYSRLNYQEFALCSRGVPFDMIHKYHMTYDSMIGLSLELEEHHFSAGSLAHFATNAIEGARTVWVGWNLLEIHKMDVDGTAYVDKILRDMKNRPYRRMEVPIPGGAVNIFRLVRKLGPEDVDGAGR